MRYYPDFTQCEELPGEPLVIHRHGENPGRALLILAHGLGGTRYGTWTPKRHNPTKASLPKFLYEDIDGLDVGLYAYRTLLGRLKWWRSIELQDEAALLADRIQLHRDDYRAIILGGHSLGGILVRAAIRELIDRDDRRTLAAIKGLMLLATPMAGSLRVPRIIWYLTADARALRPHGPLITQIQQIFTERVVSEATLAKSNQYTIPAYVVAAAEDNWVSRFSAGLHVPRERTWNVRGSHTSAVKPRTRTDDEYIWVRKQIRELADNLATEDPFEAHDLGGKFLINRTALRNALRGVTDDTRQTRVVAVKGPARSGKSYSIYYIEHIEQRLRRYDKAVIRLEHDEPPATFSPQLLVESILDLINGDRTHIPQKTVDLTETRWIRRMADYVVGQIKTRPRAVFIVLDGFAHQNLPGLTRELVRELVKRAESEPNLRIALLDYSDDLLSIESAGRFVTEPIDAFSEADLARFFADYARAHGKAHPPKKAIDTIVRSVLDAVPPGEPERNERIAKEVEAWTDRLKAES